MLGGRWKKELYLAPTLFFFLYLSLSHTRRARSYARRMEGCISIHYCRARICIHARTQRKATLHAHTSVLSLSLSFSWMNSFAFLPRRERRNCARIKDQGCLSLSRVCVRHSFFFFFLIVQSAKNPRETPSRRVYIARAPSSCGLEGWLFETTRPSDSIWRIFSFGFRDAKK